MSIEWKDATSYQRGERGNVEPSTWEARIEGAIEITVTHYVGYGDEWVCHCRPLDISTHSLGTTDVEEAKQAALYLVGHKAKATITKMEKLLLALGESA